MEITINEILMASFLEKTINEKPDIKEYLQDIEDLILNSNKKINSNLYVEKEIVKDKFAGIKNIWFIFKVNNKFIKLKANWTFHSYKELATLFVTKIIPLNIKVSNGVSIEINSSKIDGITFLSQMEQLKKQKKFILKYEDNSDIISAIELYENITIQQDKESETTIEIKKFGSPIEAYQVDYSAIKGLNIEYLKGQKSTFVNKNEADKVPKSSLSKNVYLIWTVNNISLPSGINNTLKSIIKDNGDLYTVDNPKELNKLENFVSLIDFKVKRKKKSNELFLITKELYTGDIAVNDHFAFINRLRHKKRSTMLSVMKDIKLERINNNNLFQFLFNNGNYDDVDNISDWARKIDLSKKHSSALFEKQKEAFNLSIDKFPITFIQGPPGTGKTHLITQIAKYYNDKKMNVLVSSQTNVAVENIIENLWNDKEYCDMPIKADYKKSQFSEINLVQNSLDKIKKILDLKNEVQNKILPIQSLAYESRVIGSTTTSSVLYAKRWKEFNDNIDVLIIDEISKSSVPELIRYVVNAKK